MHRNEGRSLFITGTLYLRELKVSGGELMDGCTNNNNLQD